MRTVLVVLFDNVQSLDVTGPVEVFAGAGPRPAGPVRTASAPPPPSPRRLTDWLREHGPRAERLVSVCTGAVLLARSGPAGRPPRDDPLGVLRHAGP